MPRNAKIQSAKRAEMLRAAEEVREIRAALGDVYEFFNTTTDPEMIDTCVYEISALRARYDYALKRAKARLQ